MKSIKRFTLLLVICALPAMANSSEFGENKQGQTAIQGDVSSQGSTEDRSIARMPYLGRVSDCYYYWGVGLRSNQCAVRGQRAGYYTQWLVGLGGTFCDCYGYY